VLVLLHDHDPTRRSQAHLALGHRALARDDLGTAEVHLREARALHGEDDVTRGLAEALTRAREQRRRRWFFSRA
jgi:hypothetical protein